MAVELPRDASSITGEFLSDVLGTPVKVLEITTLEGGNLSEAYRVRIAGVDAAARPPGSVVVKLPCLVEQRRDYAISVNAYSKEVAFYQQLARQVPVRSPRVYGCITDGSATCAGFAIVMEDLTSHSTVFDQIDDPPDEPFVRRIALDAARLHAAYWEAPLLDQAWLAPPDGRYGFSLDALSRAAPANLDVFLELWEASYGSPLLGDLPDVAALTALLCGRQSDAILDRIYDTLSSRPRTLLHGDLRADNVFRTSDRGHADAELTFIDWQVVHAGPPGPEFTQAWMHSLEPAVRRHDHEILALYHRCLVELRPAAAVYTLAMLEADYLASYCFWWMALITLGAGTLPDFDRPGAERMRLLWGKGMNRAIIAMNDLGCLAVVQEIVAGLPLSSVDALAR